MNITEQKYLIENAHSLLDKARREAENTIIGILREHNNRIVTTPGDCHYMEATIYCDGYEESWYPVKIHAIIYNEDYGIGLLTENGVSDYEYDNDVDFNHDYENLSGEELKAYKDMLEDESYYEYLSEGDTNFDLMKTVYNIVLLLGSFLPDEK